MSDNNEMYQMYKQMIQGYKLGPDGQNLFEHAVKCWLDLNPDNPFPEDSPAFEMFFRMKNYYSVWRLGSADRKISMRRMFNAAKELCAVKAKNPYKYDKKEAEEKRVALKESAAKEHENYLKSVEEANRQKAEHEEEVRRVMEELNQTNLENEERINIIQTAINETKEKYKNDQPDKDMKRYVFNVVKNTDDEQEDVEETKDKPNTNKKPGKIKKWLKRVLKL